MTITTQYFYPIPGCDHRIKEFHVVIYPAELREQRYSAFKLAQEMAKKEAEDDVTVVSTHSYPFCIVMIYQRSMDIKNSRIILEELAVMA